MPHQSLSRQALCYLWSPFYLVLCQKDTVKAFASSLFLTPVSCVFPLRLVFPRQNSPVMKQSGQTVKRFAWHRALLPFGVTADKLYFPLFLSLRLFCIQNMYIFCVKILVFYAFYWECVNLTQSGMFLGGYISHDYKGKKAPVKIRSLI